MSVSDLKKPTATDWAKVKALTDEEIDTSDIPPLGDGFFASATFRFEDIAKKRQARFRNTSPTISRQGRSPSDGKGQKHGHLLSLDYEEENLYPTLRGKGGALEFFKEHPKCWNSGPSGDSSQRERPTRNMASSQIACVNFLLPLADVPGALATLIRSIDGDVNEIVPISHEGNVSLVEFEWTGLGRPLEKDAAPTRGAYVTSIDAFMLASTRGGLRRAYLMEWKYTEKYRTEDKGKGEPGSTRRHRYADLYSADSSSFNGVAPMEELLYEPFYQIMRLRLLADRMVAQKEFDVAEAKVVVVVPEGNTAYREKITSPLLARRFPGQKTVAGVIRATLKHPDDAFSQVGPSTLADAVRRGCGGTVSEWATYQHERYGW